MVTDFSKVYNYFYSKVTDDMYMELDVAQTEKLLEELMLNALPWFEFPRVNINDYDLSNKCFNVELSNEEMHIIATYMVVGWIDQQLASVEVTRMKYSGADFKMTSQANHMSKLLALKKEYEKNGLHLQRLYKRRKADTNGNFKSTFNTVMARGAAGRRPRAPQLDYPGSGTCSCNDNELEWEDFDQPLYPNNGTSDDWSDS